MGTQFKIVMYAANHQIAGRAKQAAFNRIARLDAIMSDYQQASELNTLSHQAINRPLRISYDLFRVLDYSQRLAAKTNGAFDITIGAVTRLWRRARRTHQMPDKEKLTQALALTGFKKLHLDAKTQSAWLDREGVLLDLGGIAKGFAADEALEILKRLGIRSALVAAGGDIVIGQSPPGQSGWVIEVATLQANNLQNKTQLLLSNAAVSTSGDAEQFVEFDGVRYSHIVDPRTGVGIQGQSSVTVVARRGIDSDALATAVSVLGKDEGLRLINATKNVAAFITIKTLQGEMTSYASANWQAVAKPSKIRD
ncbi:MAG: FAD:protein FMN transferase [Acidobacteriota bacterium]